MFGDESPDDERHLPPPRLRESPAARPSSADGRDEAPEIEDVGCVKTMPSFESFLKFNQ
jgi:hypothetical protein